MRILLDHSVPAPLKRFLAHHDVRTTAQEGWDQLQNGLLLRVAEAGFDIFVTCDQNIAYQQNITERRIAIVTIDTNVWPVMRNDVSLVVSAIDAAGTGSFAIVSYPRPQLRRRPYLPPA